MGQQCALSKTLMLCFERSASKVNYTVYTLYFMFSGLVRRDDGDDEQVGICPTTFPASVPVSGRVTCYRSCIYHNYYDNPRPSLPTTHEAAPSLVLYWKIS